MDELTALEKIGNPDWWVDRCVNDLYFLCRTVLQVVEDKSYGFQDLWYPTHHRICDFVQKYAKPGHKILVLTPRGWVKSYIITVGWTIQQMMKAWIDGRKHHTVLANATQDNSEEFLARIRYNLQYNELLRGFFSDYIPENMDGDTERWTMKEINVGGYRVEAQSAEKNLVSRHFYTLINDDLVNKDNSAGRTQIAKVLDWWALAQSLLHPQGVEILIGTRWDFDDLYGHIIDKFIQPEDKYYFEKSSIVEMHNGKYHLLQMDCWEDPVAETGSTFPTLFPEEKLKELQLTQGDRFNGQYRNNPLAKGRNPFKKEYFFCRWGMDELPETRFTMMLIDPTGKDKESSSSTGVSVIHLSHPKKGFIEFGQRLEMTDMRLAEWIIDNASRWMPEVIGIEDNKFHTLREFLEIMVPQKLKRGTYTSSERMFIKSIPYILVELHPRGRDKDQRIRHLVGWFEDGNFILPKHGAEQLEDELIRFPSSAKKDIADALAYALDHLYFPKKDGPKKTLELDPEEKMTSEQREEKEWREIGKQLGDEDMRADFEESSW